MRPACLSLPDARLAHAVQQDGKAISLHSGGLHLFLLIAAGLAELTSRPLSIPTAAHPAPCEALQKEQALSVTALGSPSVWKCLCRSNPEPKEGKCTHSPFRWRWSPPESPASREMKLCPPRRRPPLPKPSPSRVLVSLNAGELGDPRFTPPPVAPSLVSANQPQVSPRTPVKKQLSDCHSRHRNLHLNKHPCAFFIKV